MLAKELLQLPLSKQIQEEYTTQISKSILEGPIQLSSMIPEQECAWILAQNHWLYTNQFSKAEERPKFLYNVKFITSFFVNMIKSTNNLYLQRVARFQIIRGELIRKELVQYAMQQLDGMLRVFPFYDNKEQLTKFLQMGLHLAVIECESEEFGLKSDSLALLVDKLQMLE